MKLTLTFYEYPAALAEIEFWEKIQQDKIISFSKNEQTKEQVFRLSNEVLVCLPINDGTGFKGLDIKKITQWCNKFTYYKTLIFGKVNLKQLTSLVKIQEFLEKQNQ